MSLAILNNSNKHTAINANTDDTTLDARRRQVIKKKVLAIGKMSRSYTVLTEHPELVQRLKSLSNGKLPIGILATGEEGIQEAIRQKTMSIELSKIKEEKDSVLSNQPTPNCTSTRGHV
ncbi:hypothetical protein [Parasitella parasitica]|uniref:Uncharacterized protein n=1 Tax=Parasitella parasitica TaxID=35722 RepID=A0A0B7NP31_9FUNG|nr:hypothetical protein [Parasitella parasitica]